MHIDLEAIKTAESLERYCDDQLDKRGNRVYNCPFCGSGTHGHGTAAFSLDGKGHYKCFSCNEGGDLLDLIGKVEGLQGFEDRARRAAEFCGVHVDEETAGTTANSSSAQKKPQMNRTTDYTKGRELEAAKVAEWVAAYPGSEGEEYAKGRGIDRYPLTYGYDTQRRRLIVVWPDCAYYHIDRDITDSHPHKYEKPRSGSVGSQPIFATGSGDSEALIVVEGALDAGALMSLGFKDVIALCGTGYRDVLSKLVADNYKGGVVLMLDNDDAGRSTSAKLAGELGRSGITSVEFKWQQDKDEKDADEFLGAGKGEELAVRVREATQTAADIARSSMGYARIRLVSTFEVAERIFAEDDADTPIPTGFVELDRKIGGGLMRGLYVLGSTSSFGKTTITAQISDHVAMYHPSLFVTIEQSAAEIAAKSISRLTHDKHNSVAGGITAQEMLTTTERSRWKADRHGMLFDAVSRYTEEIAPNLRILEGIAKPTVGDIRKAAKDMASEFGEPPVIFIDYLQLLAPADDRMSDKQSVDHNITALRILARDLKTPIWCVATLNRESYSGPVDLDSFKESGSIEYGCDYAFGLQPQGIADEVSSVKSAVEKKLKGNAFIAKAKRNNPRRVDLTILKNRQGETTGIDKGIPLTYYPRTNFFEA